MKTGQTLVFQKSSSICAYVTEQILANEILVYLEIQRKVSTFYFSENID